MKPQSPGGSQSLDWESGLEEKFLNTQGSALHFFIPSVASLEAFDSHFSLEKELFPFLKRYYKYTCCGQLTIKLLQLSQSFPLLGFPQSLCVPWGPCPAHSIEISL